MEVTEGPWVNLDDLVAKQQQLFQFLQPSEDGRVQHCQSVGREVQVEEMRRHSEGIHIDSADGVSAENQRGEPINRLGNPVHTQDGEGVVAQVQPCGITWEIKGQRGQIAPAAGNYITGTKAVGWASGHRGREAKTEGEQQGCSGRVATAASNVALAEKL